MTTKEYLRQAMKLESLIYEQNRVIDSMKRTIRKLENPQYKSFESKYPYFGGDGIRENVRILFILASGLIIIGAVAGVALTALWRPISSALFHREFMLKEGWRSSSFNTGGRVGAALAVVLGIAHIVRVFRDNRKVKNKNNEIAVGNQMIGILSQHKIAALRPKLAQAQQNLRTTQDILQRFYAQNVIHPKYRNFIAVSTMYGYFDTGRCTALQGHGGAYDTYENELRQNMIISKLDVVIEKLDQIADNQYALYEAMRECNQNIASVNDGLRSLQDTNNQILECSAVTMENQRITAINTSVMKELMIYDHL